MQIPPRSLTTEELVTLCEARKTRLVELQGTLALAPTTEETHLQRRLVARALYSTWLDLQQPVTEAGKR